MQNAKEAFSHLRPTHKPYVTERQAASANINGILL